MHKKLCQPAILPTLVLSTGQIPVLDEDVPLKWLGVLIDSHLSMRPFVLSRYRSAFFQLRTIRYVRDYLDASSTLLLCNALVLSRIDYCCSQLIVLSQIYITKLQRVINLAARTISRTRRFDHISPILSTLEWMSMSDRITFRVCCCVYQSLYGRFPSYLSECLVRHTTARNLRSITSMRLEPGRARIRIGEGSFSSAGPRMWNGLPFAIRNLRTYIEFCMHLKQYLLSHHQ